ncbi:unnamed protein product [Rotaria sp. Silwood2]|nr:unnamed protein product [Rotaria sp. Silwood2]CAF4332614.1 unnamed protein product [Rotaria sp. Silwood2]
MMLYMPTATLTTPVIVQETQTIPIQTTTTRYYMLPTTTITPVVPLLNTALVYPAYGIITKPIEKTNTEKSQISEVQHVVHHYPPSTCSVKHCPGYCELCCPWIEQSHERQSRSRSRSRSPSPPTHDQQRYSRRDEYDRSQHYLHKDETIDDKIERIRHELNLNSSSKRDKSTETIDYYHPSPIRTTTTVEQQRIPYKQHYDPPKPRPRSTSSHRASSLPREPWRTTNQNDYPWRDAHLPAYRQESLSRSQTPANENYQWNETAHQRSHLNTQNQSSSSPCKNNYIYRPKSEIETRKYYMQTTGKDPDCEVYQSLNHNTTSCCNKQQTKHEHSFYSDIPTTTTLKQMNISSCPNVCRSDDTCLHIIPKHGSTLDPPYLKIYNSPVTYLH